MRWIAKGLIIVKLRVPHACETCVSKLEITFLRSTIQQKVYQLIYKASGKFCVFDL